MRGAAEASPRYFLKARYYGKGEDIDSVFLSELRIRILKMDGTVPGMQRVELFCGGNHTEITVCGRRRRQ